MNNFPEIPEEDIKAINILVEKLARFIVGLMEPEINNEHCVSRMLCALNVINQNMLHSIYSKKGVPLDDFIGVFDSLGKLGKDDFLNLVKHMNNKG